MQLLPAIDLRAGSVVRLKQGRAADQSIYSDNPAAVAARWQAEGATWLHVVDLDAALGSGSTANARALREIRSAVQIRIQLGGGLRDLDAIQRALDLGVDRVLLGTLVVEQPDALAEAVAGFGGDRIVPALDHRSSRVAVRGWGETTAVDVEQLGRRLCGLGLRRAVVTDIARDGMLSGVDAASLAQIAARTGLRIIASGGIATLDDLRALVHYEKDGIEGAIIGRALYSGALTLADALAVVGKSKA